MVADKAELVERTPDWPNDGNEVRIGADSAVEINGPITLGLSARRSDVS